MVKKVIVTALLCLCAPVIMMAGDHTGYYKLPKEDGVIRLHHSEIDYGPLAAEIVAGCSDDYERLKAIYEWMCDNIEYDTTFSVYSADECYRNRRGVCQGYCELFCQMAKTLNIRVEMIGGVSKMFDGFISPSGHAWLFGYVAADRGILIDPTWGAGMLLNGQYVRNKDNGLWFNTDPEWMILSHLPADASYQLLTDSVSTEEFRTMEPANPLWLTYGISIHDVYRMTRYGEGSLPAFYNGGEGDLEAVNIPMSSKLRIGETYTLRIRMTNDREFTLTNGSLYVKKPQWHNEGDGIYSIDFMPRYEGAVKVSLKDRQRPSYWNNIIEYGIETPTADDWLKVENSFPLSAPDAQNVKNLKTDKWEAVGIDGRKLLQAIRSEHITELPILYIGHGQKLTFVDMPLNGILKTGREYTFSFLPKSGVKWALIVNGSKWLTDWKQKDGVYTMTYTPKTGGSVELYVQLDGNSSYISCVEYKVE